MKQLLLAAGIAASIVAAPALAQSPQTVRVGVTPGPHAQILEAVKPIAAKRGLDVKIVEFSDYVVPNAALDSGELEANSFQHAPYLDNQKTDRGFKIEAVGSTVNFPMGIYSRKHKSFDAVPQGGSIAIPNDPTNGGRALLLLQDKGALKLKPDVGFKPSVADIVENPKRLKFIEVDAAQTPRSLDDVDAAAVNTNYLVSAGLNPADAIVKEDPKGPYVNLIAVRAADKDKPWVKELVAAYRSPEVKAFIADKFKGAVIASW
ncbi:MetQ/NlpA family ABC transporter substrate-binding protein [Enterovirga sp. CN4-39]|uniref:MetQ/NlpA family ABC transporter substrate-binding protein n=1 Tax=Enterovirga sp. CN4-39 TaxID=3400910 RepID=UPI003BFBDC52